MRRLLYLSHRIPFPPDKGEKIRAWHILEHLARRFAVDVGCLVDDPADLRHVPALAARVASLEAHQVAGGARAYLRALRHLKPGGTLTRGWFFHPALDAWVRKGLASGRYDAVFVYSSAMAPYVMGHPRHPATQVRVLDLVDVDSAKFKAYAQTGTSLLRPVHAREARTLLALERAAAKAFDHTLLASAAEVAHFHSLAPEAGHVQALDNGVDAARFDPAGAYPNPFPDGAPAIVFTGAMGYRPNIDAVTWFAEAVLPRLRGRSPAPSFHIVGANPASSVRALAAHEGVFVTGTVPDIRPYLAHAAVAVAPLQIARGIQNKVLEAMAMARPVVATTGAFEGVRAVPGRDLLVADAPSDFAGAVAAVLDGAHPALGAAGRAAMLAGHDWSATLAPLDAMLGSG
ncbi:TIGR03087 family PEP-CTERM/XrtA system glycosyltransferase [Elioraea sp.]|uniref:TIGR03087 family PEP-CTERM/XrtA system glycosyltransferase n=1 Tax=Elioraea sp. TaxID=2185103 RepID=UPI0025BF0250|nr:TIGR03087 family PEP-CTERM/XrtA system glycosyltransferase [Elioraea sp.]